jgi:hypothetical protein
VIYCQCSESDDDVSKMVWRRKAVWKSGAGTWCHCNTMPPPMRRRQETGLGEAVSRGAQRVPCCWPHGPGRGDDGASRGQNSLNLNRASACSSSRKDVSTIL